MNKPTIIDLLNSIAEKDEEYFYPSQQNKTDDTCNLHKMSHFLNTPIFKLQYEKISENGFFSERYVSELKEKLWAKSYKSRSQEDEADLDKFLKKWSSFEFKWKEYHKRVIFNHSMSKIEDAKLKKTRDEFFRLMNEFRFSKMKSQRSYRYQFGPRFAESTKELFQLAVYDQEIELLKEFSKADIDVYEKIITELVSNDIVFDTIVKQIIKSAHEELLTEKEFMFHDIGITVTRSRIQYEIQQVFLLTLFASIIHYAQRKKILKDEIAILNIQKSLQYFVENRAFIYQTKLSKNNFNPWGSHCDSCMRILMMLTNSGLFESESKKRENNRDHVYYTLPQSLEVEVMKSLKVPSIKRPKRLNKSDIDSLIKPLQFGTGSITKTNHLVKALNISRQKRFKVNSKFLQFCMIILKTDKYDITDSPLDFGFAMPKDIALLTKAQQLNAKVISQMDSTYENAVFNLADQCSKVFDFSFKNIGVIFNILGCPTLQNKFYQEKIDIEEKLKVALTSLNFARSRLILADTLQTFSLFVTDSMCLRLRLYPTEFWISRTAGSLKYLTYDFTAKELTLKGHIYLLRAFYQGYPDLDSKFNQYLRENSISKRRGKSLLNEFFLNNLPKQLPSKNSLLYANLYIPLYEQCLNQPNQSKTSINVEIDQSASALVFLSFILRDETMAEISNALGGERSSPYDYIRNSFPAYYEKNAEKFTFNKKAYDFVCNSEKLTKYAIMCFAYGQQPFGRFKDFSKRWNQEIGYMPNSAEQKFLNEFASSYTHFVDFVFPNSVKKLNLLNEIMTIMAKDASQHEIKTLTGEVLRWSFFKSASTTRRFYDVANSSYCSYKLNVVNKNCEIDYRGMKRRFLSYFIHSIDSSILRCIIVKMKNDHNVTINHLHDCILIHPNYVDTLFDVLSEVYQENNLYNVTENLLFSHIDPQLSPESAEEVAKLKSEFYSMCDNFEHRVPDFNPRNMYKFEK